MKTPDIEIEITLSNQEQAEKLTTTLLNGSSRIGYKHGSWMIFITCPSDEILHLGQELHYALSEMFEK